MKFGEMFRTGAPKSTPKAASTRPPRILTSTRLTKAEAAVKADTQFQETRVTAVSKRIKAGHVDEVTTDEKRELLTRVAKTTGTRENFADLLPLMFRVNSKNALSLTRYPPFKAFYNFKMPTKFLMRCGRQVSKSTSLAFKKVYQAATIPNYKILFVTPLYEQARRFSSNYVKPAIEMSLMRGEITDSTTTKNVLEKTFINGSRLTFTYAFRDADRARGIPSDEICYDESQDLDFSFLPVINASMSASPWQIETYAGTPKTMDNTMAKLWEQSSQGEWVIPCRSCRKENVPAIAYDLLNMIATDTLRCANSKCKYPLYSEDGQWIHRYPERIALFTAIHIPQAILPIHYSVVKGRTIERFNTRPWQLMLAKINKDPKRMTYNEVHGEDCDVGSKLISQTTLQKASSMPWRNIPEQAMAVTKTRRYRMISLGIDWGGRGEDGDSFTAMAVTGLLPNGETESIFAIRMLPSEGDAEEIAMAKRLYQDFNCTGIGHDVRGVGQAKDTMLRDAGFRHLTPWSNEPAQVRFFAKTNRGPTGHIFVQINRAAAIMLLAHEFNNGRFRLPQWEDDSAINVYLDLNSWYENYIAMPDGRNLYHIMRSATQPDDVGMAHIYSSFTNYRRLNAWPRYVQTLTPEGFVIDTNVRVRGSGEE